MDRTTRRFGRTAERGMTLIEIMVVVAIIGLVMGGVAVVAIRAHGRAQLRVAQSEIGELKAAIHHWRLDNAGETCPKTLQELYAQKYVSKARDPWGQEFLYACPSQTPGEDFDIVSKGPDRQPGTDDDVKENDAKTP